MTWLCFRYNAQVREDENSSAYEEKQPESPVKLATSESQVVQQKQIGTLVNFFIISLSLPLLIWPALLCLNGALHNNVENKPKRSHKHFLNPHETKKRDTA